MTVKPRDLLYIAFVQALFSALDIYARMSLREYGAFWDAIGAPWFTLWLAGQLGMLPLQIRLIARNGIGRGVALMNAFSVLFSCAGGWFIAHEALRAQDAIAAGMVIVATWMFVTSDRSESKPALALTHKANVPSLAEAAAPGATALASEETAA